MLTLIFYVIRLQNATKGARTKANMRKMMKEQQNSDSSGLQSPTANSEPEKKTKRGPRKRKGEANGSDEHNDSIEAVTSPRKKGRKSVGPISSEGESKPKKKLGRPPKPRDPNQPTPVRKPRKSKSKEMPEVAIAPPPTSLNYAAPNEIEIKRTRNSSGRESTFFRSNSPRVAVVEETLDEILMAGSPIAVPMFSPTRGLAVKSKASKSTSLVQENQKDAYSFDEEFELPTSESPKKKRGGRKSLKENDGTPMGKDEEDSPKKNQKATDDKGKSKVEGRQKSLQRKGALSNEIETISDKPSVHSLRKTPQREASVETGKKTRSRSGKKSDEVNETLSLNDSGEGIGKSRKGKLTSTEVSPKRGRKAKKAAVVVKKKAIVPTKGRRKNRKKGKNATKVCFILRVYYSFVLYCRL